MRDQRKRYGTSSRSRRTSRRDQSQGSSAGFFIFLIVVALGIYIYLGRDFKSDFNAVKAWSQTLLDGTTEVESTPTVYQTPCTQANIVRVMAHTLLDEVPTSTDPNAQWYEKYYEVIKEDERFSFFKIENALAPLTYEQTSKVFSRLISQVGAVTLSAPSDVGSQNISMKQFLVNYEKALQHQELESHFEYKTLSLIATTTTNAGLNPWEVMSHEGIYRFDGLVIDPFIGTTIVAATKGNEILGIIEGVNKQLIIPDAYISEVTESEVTIKIGTIYQTYKHNILKASHKGKVAKLMIQNGEVVDFELSQASYLDRVLRVTPNYIELEKGGRFEYDELTLSNETKLAINHINQLNVGSRVSYTAQEGKISTLHILQESDPTQIRVVLTEDGLGDYTHEGLEVTSEEGMVIYNGEKTYTYQPNEIWNIEDFQWEEGIYKLSIHPTEGKTLTINSIERQKRHPKYKGILEIYKDGEGLYTVVNELPLETYLESVIPSEMPPAYGIEAAKVQAIAARSYAYIYQNSNKFSKYGAQVDDTTSSQVYNNVPANDFSKHAAKQTEHQVMSYNGEVISGNFFSTSCGYTANYGETWANGEIFPTNTPIYLVSRQQYLGQRDFTHLKKEEDAYKFLTLKPDEIDAFDNHSPWFRWRVKMDQETLSQQINYNVARLSSQYANAVKIQDAEGNWSVKEVDSLGEIIDMQIIQRGEGGNVMELLIIGTKHSMRIETEYLIRIALMPLEVLRGDGSVIKSMAMLPSAFFAPDITYRTDGNLKEITLYGGGFGHGVGMSQSGVKGMVDRGYTYREILRHYYPNIEIVSLEK